MKWIKLFEEYGIDTTIETSNRIFIAFIIPFITQKFIQESNLIKTSAKVKKVKSWADEELPWIDIIARTSGAHRPESAIGSTVIAQLEITEDFKYLRITKSGFKLIFNFVNDYAGKSLTRIASKSTGSYFPVSDFENAPLFQIFRELINRIMDNLLKNELDTKDFLKLKNQDVVFVSKAFEDYVYVLRMGWLSSDDKYFTLR